MKDAISNYGRILIVIIVLLSLVGFIFGGIWLSKIGKVTDEINPDVTPDTVVNRAAPTLNVSDLSAIVGRELYVKGLVSATNADGDDISSEIKITSEDNLYDSETGCFLATEAGKYTLTVSVSDPKASEYSLSLTTTKKITIVVNASLDKFLINTMPVPHGKVAVSSQVVRADTTVKITNVADKGYTLSSVKIKYQLPKTKEELEIDNKTKVKDIEEDVSLETLCFTMPSADVVIIPEYTPIDVTVVYNPNGGDITGDSVFVKKFDSPYGNGPVVSRTGYVFTGWFTAKKDGNKIEENTLVSNTETHTLFAHWEKAVYKVTCKPGTGATLNGEEQKSVEYGSRIGTLPTATKEGYTFAGWVLHTDHSVSINARTKFTFSKNIVLDAEWTPATTIINFNPNGGDVSTTSKVVKFGQPYGSMPIPTMRGYDFVGWFTEKENGTLIESNSIVALTGTQTFYAHWVKTTYTITFNANGGQFPANAVKTLKIHNGDKINCSSITTPTNGTREFLGWYTGSEGGYKINPNTIYTYESNITLYAHWSTIPVNITLHYDNGDADKTVTFNVGTRYGSILDIAVKDGFILSGWKTNTGEIVNSNSYVQEGITDLTAQWRGIDYKITFIQNPHLSELGITAINGTLPTKQVTFANGDKASSVFAGCTATADNLLFDHWVVIDGENEYDLNNDTVLTYKKNITVYPAYKNASLIYFNNENEANNVLNSIKSNSLNANLITKTCKLMNTNESTTYYVVCDLDNGTVLGSYDSFNPYKDNKSVIAVYPSLTIDTIGKNAFENCENLRTFEWYNSVRVIGDSAFAHTHLSNIKIPSSAIMLGKSSFNFAEEENSTIDKASLEFLTNQTLTQTKGTTNKSISVKDVFGQDITIPSNTMLNIIGEETNGQYLVKSIIDEKRPNQYACYIDKNDISISSVTTHPESYIDNIPEGCFTNAVNGNIKIPASVVNIDKFAFENCNIDLLSLAENSSLKYVDDGAFKNAIKGDTCILNLAEDAPELSYIGKHAFYNCNISRLTLPTKEPLSLDEYAFANTDLSAHTASKDNDKYDPETYNPLIIPENVTFVGNYVFKNTKVGALEIQDGVGGLNDVCGLFAQEKNNFTLQNLKIPCNFKLSGSALNYSDAYASFFHFSANCGIQILEVTKGKNSKDITKSYYNLSEVYNDYGVDPSEDLQIAGYTTLTCGSSSLVFVSHPKTIIINNGVFTLSENFLRDTYADKLENLTVPVTCNILRACYIQNTSTKQYTEIATGKKIVKTLCSTNVFGKCPKLKSVTITEEWIDEDGNILNNLKLSNIKNRQENLYKYYASNAKSMDNLYNINDVNLSAAQNTDNKTFFAINEVTNSGLDMDYCGLNNSRPSYNPDALDGLYKYYPWYSSYNFTDLSIEDGVVYIPRAMFFNCKVLTNIKMPCSLIVDTGVGVKGLHSTGDSISNISANTVEHWQDFDSFGNCTNITNIILTKGVNNGKSYNYSASTKKMMSKTYEGMGDGSRIGTNNTPWHDSTQPLEIEYENGVTTIGTYSFGNIYEIGKTYTKPSATTGIKSVDSKSFDYKRTTIKKLIIPDSVIEIGDYALHLVNWDNATISVPVDIDFNYTQRSAAFVNTSKNYDEDNYTHTANKINFGGGLSVGDIVITNDDYKIATRMTPFYSTFSKIILTKGYTGIGRDYNATTYRNLPWANPLTYNNNTPVDSIIIGIGVKSIGDYYFYKLSGNYDSIMFETNESESGFDTFSGFEENTFSSDSNFINTERINGFTAKYTGSSNAQCLISLVHDGDSNNEYTVRNNTVVILKDALINYSNSSTTIINIPSSVKYIGDRALYTDSDIVLNIADDTHLKNLGNSIINVNHCKCDALINENNVFYLRNSYGDKTRYYAVDYISTGLDDVTLKDGTVLMAAGLFENTPIRSINIPGTIDKIPAYTFEYCKSLSSVTLNEGTTTIEENAFYNCTSLYSIDIPSSIQSIGQGALNNKMSINISDDNKHFVISDGMLLNDEGTRLLLVFYKDAVQDICIPDKVITVDKSALRGLNIKSLIIPNNVDVGDYAFADLTGLKSLEMPINLIVNETTFKNDANIIDISLTGSHANVFENEKDKSILYEPWYISAKSLQTLTLSSNIDNYSYAFANKSVKFTVLNNITIKDYGTNKISGFNSENNASLAPWILYTGSNKGVYVAKTISVNIDNSITDIGPYSFYTADMSNITLPNSIQTIGAYSFASSNIDNNILTSVLKNANAIGDYAFIACNSLTGVKIPQGVTSIGEYAFYRCTSLNSITIPDSVTSIGRCTFNGCKLLTNVIIGNGVTSIGDYAFAGCTSLESITIPDSVTSIGEYAFYGCTSLDSVIIPDGVTSIGRCTFNGCKSLTSVIIGNGVTSIDYYAFYNCTSLTSITIPNTVTFIDNDAFTNCTQLKDVYGVSGSEAENFAINNGLNFIEI